MNNMSLRQMREMMAAAMGQSPMQHKRLEEVPTLDGREAKRRMSKHRKGKVLMPGPGGAKGHRPPSKTGRPTWWLQMKEQARLRRILQDMGTFDALHGSGIPNPTAHNLSLAYPNVWALSRAETKALVKIDGVGPATVKKMDAFLAGKNVPLQRGDS